MITKEIAMTARRFEHVSRKNKDGTPVRCRANGKCKAGSKPNEFRLPVKYGMYQWFAITQYNASEWKAA